MHNAYKNDLIDAIISHLEGFESCIPEDVDDEEIYFKMYDCDFVDEIARENILSEDETDVLWDIIHEGSTLFDDYYCSYNGIPFSKSIISRTISELEKSRP